MSSVARTAAVPQCSDERNGGDGARGAPKFRALRLWQGLEERLNVCETKDMRFGRRFYKDCLRGSEIVTAVLGYLHEQPEERFQKAERPNVEKLCGKLLGDGFLALVKDQTGGRMCSGSLHKQNGAPSQAVASGSASTNGAATIPGVSACIKDSDKIIYRIVHKPHPERDDRDDDEENAVSNSGNSGAKRSKGEESPQHNKQAKTKVLGMSFPTSFSFGKPSLLGFSFGLGEKKTQPKKTAAEARSAKRKEKARRRKRLATQAGSNRPTGSVVQSLNPTASSTPPKTVPKFVAPPARQFPPNLMSNKDNCEARAPLRNNFMGSAVTLRGSMRRRHVSLLKQVEDYTLKLVALQEYAKMSGRTVEQLLADPSFHEGVRAEASAAPFSTRTRAPTTRSDKETATLFGHPFTWNTPGCPAWITVVTNHLNTYYEKGGSFHSVTVFTPHFEKIVFHTEQECWDALRKFLLRMPFPLLPPSLLYLVVDTGVASQRGKSIAPALSSTLFTLLPRAHAEVLKVLCVHWQIVCQHRTGKNASGKIAKDMAIPLTHRIPRGRMEAVVSSIRALIEDPSLLKVDTGVKKKASIISSQMHLSMSWEHSWPRTCVLAEPCASGTHDFLVRLLLLPEERGVEGDAPSQVDGDQEASQGPELASEAIPSISAGTREAGRDGTTGIAKQNLPGHLTFQPFLRPSSALLQEQRPHAQSREAHTRQTREALRCPEAGDEEQVPKEAAVVPGMIMTPKQQRVVTNAKRRHGSDAQRNSPSTASASTTTSSTQEASTVGTTITRFTRWLWPGVDSIHESSV